jgi:hypothetical protein
MPPSRGSKEMDMANPLTELDVQQLRALHQELTAAKALPDPCAIWKRVKPFWPIILKAIRLIPVVGSIVADILDALGQALDTFCAGK